MAEYDTIIIGGGLSALAAGIRLAHFGQRVRIFERHIRTGGLNSWYPGNGGAVVDTGLHALTNFVPADQKEAPLNLILRQLRVSRAALELCPQSRSVIAFPGAKLFLNNDFQAFVDQIKAQFPSDYDGFMALLQRIEAIGYHSPPQPWTSTNAVLAECIKSPLLQNMLRMPVMFYGNPSADDMDFQSYAVMFKSVLIEGLCQPKMGMRNLLQLLEERYAKVGGELSTGLAIRSIELADGAVRGVVDGRGEVHTASQYITTAGAVETAALCQPPSSVPAPLSNCSAGQMGFIEVLVELPKPVAEYGCHECIGFLNSSEEFRYHPVDDPMAPPESLLLCAPGNYQGAQQTRMLRLSAIAPLGWLTMPQNEYATLKRQVVHGVAETLANFYPELATAVKETGGLDTYTPRTIQRFTCRINGAIYGSPDKLKDFRTGVSNLRVAGTDQGLLGIVGSLLSGIVISNQLLSEGG